MSAKSVSLSSMFGWVVDALKLFQKAPSTMIGAGGLTVLMVIVFCLPMWLYMVFVMMPGMASGALIAGGSPFGGHVGAFYGMYAATLLLSLGLFPPVLIGWFRICQGMDQGRTVPALELLAPYRDAPAWFCGLRFALLAFLVYMLVMGLVIALFFWPMFGDLQRMAANPAAGAGASSLPVGMLARIVLGYLVFIPVLLTLQFAYMLGFGEVSLARAGAVDALRRGFHGAARNLLKLFVFMFCMMVLMGFALLAVELVVILLAMLLSLISPWLGGLVGVIFIVAIMLTVYPLMFAGAYFSWKGVLGDDSAATAADASTLTA